MAHAPDGAFDATIILDAKPRPFSQPIVTVSAGTGGRRLPEVTVKFKLCGRKTAACSLKDTISLTTDKKGEGVLTWTGENDVASAT